MSSPRFYIEANCLFEHTGKWPITNLLLKQKGYFKEEKESMAPSIQGMTNREAHFKGDSGPPHPTTTMHSDHCVQSFTQQSLLPHHLRSLQSVQ